MAGNGATRRLVFLAVAALALISLFFLSPFHVQDAGIITRTQTVLKSHTKPTKDGQRFENAIAPKLGNETIKAELGRAAWRLLHTTFARFPEEPTEDESHSLKTYIHLFQRLYPCGECAQHFHELLKKYPPQTASRTSAQNWGCFIHNEVNKGLKKPLFDCAYIGDHYDCGCADDETEEKKE